MRMLRTPPFFPSNWREKPCLELSFRFGLQHDFLNNGVRFGQVKVGQQFLESCGICLETGWSRLFPKKLTIYQALFLAGTVTQFKNQHSVDKVNKLSCNRKFIKKALLLVLGLCVFLNFRYSSKYLAQFTQPSIEPSCWCTCTSVEHKHGSQIIV